MMTKGQKVNLGSNTPQLVLVFVCWLRNAKPMKISWTLEGDQRTLEAMLHDLWGFSDTRLAWSSCLPPSS